MEEAIKAMRQAKDLAELKQLYRAFAIQFHPDHGGDEETMKAINIEFSKLFEILKVKHNEKAEADRKAGNYKGAYTTTETPEEFIDIVAKLSKIQGIIIELCGSWLWISGNTKDNKEELKSAGCKWAQGKQQWYWRHEEDGFGRKGVHHKEWSIDEIRSTYGSQVVSQDDNQVVKSNNKLVKR